MEHEQHQTPVAVPGAVARIGACQEGGDLGMGAHGREAERTWHGWVPFGCRRGFIVKSSVWKYLRYAYTGLSSLRPACPRNKGKTLWMHLTEWLPSGHTASRPSRG